MGQLLAAAGSREDLSDDVIVDNIIAAAFGNASAGPTAAKLLQHLSAADRQEDWERLRAELASQGEDPMQKLPISNAGGYL